MMLRKTFAATAAALALAACGPQPEAPAPEAPASETPPTTETPSTGAQDAIRAVSDAARRTPNPLDALFAKAAGEFNVPVNLLKAISFAGDPLAARVR
ncbi:hypothetical protein ACLESD_43505 [Pyxidicoccus sp. 3LFB2]